MTSVDLIKALLDIEERLERVSRCARRPAAAQAVTGGDWPGCCGRSVFDRGRSGRRGSDTGMSAAVRVTGVRNSKACGTDTASQPAQRHKPAISRTSEAAKAALVPACRSTHDMGRALRRGRAGLSSGIVLFHRAGDQPRCQQLRPLRDAPLSVSELNFVAAMSHGNAGCLCKSLKHNGNVCDNARHENGQAKKLSP